MGEEMWSRGEWGWGGVSFSGGGRYKTWMRDREVAKAWERVVEVKK